jgi:hypothetical protein
MMISLLALAAMALAGSSSAFAVGTSAAGTSQLRLTGMQTNLLILAPDGASSPYRAGPLSTGDRVLGLDSIFQDGSKVGHDYETSRVGFGFEVLCEDMLTLDNKGDLLISWQFTWPVSGQPPWSWDGVIAGDTGSYMGVNGDYHAILERNGTFQTITKIVRPS